MSCPLFMVKVRGMKVSFTWWHVDGLFYPYIFLGCLIYIQLLDSGISKKVGLKDLRDYLMILIFLIVSKIE